MSSVRAKGFVFAMAACIASSASAQMLVGAQFRKTHAVTGDQNLAIDIQKAISGFVSIEPRQVGSGHVVVFQFDTPITSVGTATVTDANLLPIGMAGMPTFSGAEVAVPLSGIPDNSRLIVSVNAINGSVNASVSVGFLIGDVDSSNAVVAADVSAVKARSGFVGTAQNARFDVTASGAINAADIASVKSNIGLSLPQPGQYSLRAAVTGSGTGSISSTPAGISCPGGTCVLYQNAGTSIDLVATPASNSLFSGWLGDCVGGTGVSTVMLNKSSECAASFAIKTYTVSATAGANGSVGPSSQTVTHGATASFTLTPNSGFMGNASSGCGGNLSGNTFVTGPVTAACTVSATFSPVQYAVTPSAGVGGVISPSSVQMISGGTTTVFTLTPNTGFFGTVSGTCGGSLSGNVFTTNVINGPCTVDAMFQRTTFAVTPSAGPNGTISPSTPQNIVSGSTATFVVTPNAGYTATVGGTCGGTLTGTMFVTNPITGLCSVAVTFAASAAKYVATTGNDTTGDGSAAKPWKTIGKGIAAMAGGDTLVVKAGVYTGLSNFIKGVKAGTAAKYTVIMAETPMDVRIQSTTSLNYYDNMVSLANSFIKVDGFIFDMAGSTYPPHIGDIEGNYNKITRSIFKRSGDIDQFGGLLFIGGNDNLVEDVAGVGACRYCFEQGGPDAATQRTIWRRVIGRMDYSNSAQPKATFATYGNNDNNNVRDHLYQNVISIDGQRPGNFGGEEKYGGFYLPKNAQNVTCAGCMVLNEGVGYAGMFFREFNSVNTAKHSVIWNLPGSLAGAGSIIINNASNMTLGGSIPGGAAPDTITPFTASLIGPSVKPANLLNNTPGAVVLKRWGVSGTRWGESGYDQITTEDLWPWPYQDKIKAVFRELNNPPLGNSPSTNNTLRGFASDGNGLYGGPITLTSYIWEFLGTPCPSTACP